MVVKFQIEINLAGLLRRLRIIKRKMEKKEVIRIIDNWYARKLSKDDIILGSTLRKLINDIENASQNKADTNRKV